MPNKMMDLAGMQFGRLTVIAVVGKTSYGAYRWQCRCECGAERIVFANCLQQGNTRSCGCLSADTAREVHYRHGRTKTPIWMCWQSMLNRCRQVNHPRYKDWGGRGITVCERWQTFENFLADMGDRPPGMTLERSDNDKGYSPDNCVWATPKQQARNRRPYHRRSREETAHA